MISRRFYLLVFSLFAIASMTVGCSYDNDLGPNELLFASPNQMADLSDTVWKSLKARETLITEGESYQRVSDVTTKVVSAAYQDPLEWKVVILDRNEVVAFALPNKQIAISNGALGYAENDDQLAALIAHMVAHVNYNHPGERYSQSSLAKNGFTARGIARAYDRDRAGVEKILGLEPVEGQRAPYSREHSLAADKFSIRYMIRAGYDPQEAVAFWAGFSAGPALPSGQIALHPVDNTRLRRLEQEIELISK